LFYPPSYQAIPFLSEIPDNNSFLLKYATTHAAVDRGTAHELRPRLFPLFVVKPHPFRSNSTPLRPTPSYSAPSLTKFADRKQGKGEEYRVGDLVLLSTKDLKWQIKGRRLEKLTERFVGPYKIKGIISSNAVELELPKSIKIHPVVNVSRIQLYRPQVEGQKKTPPKLVIIEEEEEFEVEKILNKRIVQGKEKFLV